MNRPRPHIPLSVRVQVAERQLIECGILTSTYLTLLGPVHTRPEPLSLALKHRLSLLFGDKKYHLDHNPALRIRKFNLRTGKYTPDANDPAHLIYRDDHAHHIKTNVRGDGAQFPDRVLIKRERRREKPKKAKRTKWPKRKVKWPSRPLRSRSTFSQRKSKSQTHRPGYRPVRHIRRLP